MEVPLTSALAITFLVYRVYSECLWDSFACDDGTCLHRELQCDGTQHCNNDEQGCMASCLGSFNCNDNSSCINWSQTCDGELDCDDSSDELSCLPPTATSCIDYKCDDGQCITKSRRCDGVSDCDNGDDEAGCTTTPDFSNSYVTSHERSNAGVSYVVLGVVGLLAIVGITILVVYACKKCKQSQISPMQNQNVNEAPTGTRTTSPGHGQPTNSMSQYGANYNLTSANFGNAYSNLPSSGYNHPAHTSISVPLQGNNSVAYGAMFNNAQNYSQP